MNNKNKFTNAIGLFVTNKPGVLNRIALVFPAEDIISTASLFPELVILIFHI